MAWVVPCAHGTPTIKLWSFDVRSKGPFQATLVGGETSKLGRGVDKWLNTRKNHSPACSLSGHTMLGGRLSS